MRIGILTFHRAINYGAVLQCYALQEFLINQGYDVEIINYHCRFIENQYKVFNLRRIKSKNPLLLFKKLFKEIIYIKRRKRLKESFKVFIENHLNLSVPIYNVVDVPLNYDIYIHGSDQIWNGSLTGGIDDLYIGCFSPTHGAKISYAASMTASITNEERNRLRSSLRYFKAISVREQSIAQFVKDLTGRNVEHVIDPTLLVEKQCWDNLLSTTNVISIEYIFVYMVGDNPVLNIYAKQIAKKYGLKIIECTKNIISPIDFVRYIKYAKFVVSNSFHATAFSIIFKKQFYTMASQTEKDCRFIDLLSFFNIQGRVIYDKIVSYEDIDYHKLDIDQKLEDYRKCSKSFLINNINSI